MMEMSKIQQKPFISPVISIISRSSLINLIKQAVLVPFDAVLESPIPFSEAIPSSSQQEMLLLYFALFQRFKWRVVIECKPNIEWGI